MLPVVPVCAAQAMQKGISVDLPFTANASPVPDADRGDSLIVAVTGNGRVYLGTDPIGAVALAQRLKNHPSTQPEKNLYLKVDAHTSYANVTKVLNALRKAHIEAATLLTNQREVSLAKTVVPPKGLKVLIDLPSASSSGLTIKLVRSKQRLPELKINGEQIPKATLQNRLWELLENQPEKVVRLKADGLLPFVHVVHVIDACRSTGAEVVLIL